MMKRLLTAVSVGYGRSVLIGTLFLVGLFLFAHVLPRSSGADPVTSVSTTGSGQPGNVASNALSKTLLFAPRKEAWLDPAKVMGVKACINCHRSEYLAWRPTKHYASVATIAGTGGNIPKYAESLGIKVSDVMSNSLCAKCHAATQADRRGRVRVISGISCESCHGASGGEQGWLNRHAVYGPNVTPADRETPGHRQARVKYCEEAGMIRAERLYSIAKNCYQCHSVTYEKLVNAGHKIGSFELIGASTGEVRHNFHEKQAVNAAGPSLWMKQTGRETAQRRRVKFIVGVLVDLEVSLTALAAITDGEGEYVVAYVERLGGAQEILGGIVDALEDDAPDVLGEAMETIEGIEAEDSDFGEKEAQKTALAAATMIAQIARKFAARDGSKLAGVDEFMNDEVVEAKGKVFSR